MATEQKHSFTRTLSAAIALTVLVIATGAGCGGASTTAPDASTKPETKIEAMAGYKVYSNSEKGFAIQYPEKWKMEEGFMATDVIFNAPVKNEFSENLNVITKTIPGASNVSLNDLKTSLIDSYKTAVTGFNLIEAKNTTLDGQPGLLFSYTGSQGTIKGSFVQYFITKGDDAYIITVTRPQNDTKRSEKEFTDMINSFKILK